MSVDSSVEEQPPGTHTVCSVQNMYVCVYVCVCVCVQSVGVTLAWLSWLVGGLPPPPAHPPLPPQTVGKDRKGAWC